MSRRGPSAPAARAWLIACLRALGTGQAPPAPPLDLDWPALVDIAAAEDVAPALAYVLGAAGWAGVPASVRRRLGDDLAASRARHWLMMDQAGPVLQRCAAVGVEVIVLKGPALGERLYPDPALRPCSDLDLLVRSADRGRADAALRSLGHRHVADEHSWDFDVAYDGATVYETPGGLRIDLHWRLLTEPRFVWYAGEQEIWQRSEAITVAAAPARGLGPEDLLLYLAAHLAVHHTLTGLLRYWDVARLLAQEAAAFDWERLLARAARWRVRHALFFVLRGARARFDAPVSAEALAALRPTGPRAALLAAIERRSDAARLLRLEHLVTLLLVDRGRDVCDALGRAVWPSAGWMRARYGVTAASRSALYRAHARRLGGVVGSAAGALLRGGAHQLR